MTVTDGARHVSANEPGRAELPAKDHVVSGEHHTREDREAIDNWLEAAYEDRNGSGDFEGSDF